MDSISAFAMGEASRGNESKVFDWDKAARLIRERKPNIASAGLESDWEFTGGDIYKDGDIVKEGDTYVYLASTWATPEISLDGDIVECYKMQSKTPNWGADTYWPESALKILRG